MLAIALNPGFVMLIGALVVLAAPATLRSPVMLLSALGALGLLLAPDYGRYGAFAQIGLTMAPLNLDGLNYLFGLAFIGGAVLLSIYAGASSRRFEDAAILMLAGAATSALFVGDLVSFVAAAELAGFAAAWIVFCAGDRAAFAAGVRLLIWQGLEGLLLLAGVAFLLSDGLRSEFGQLNAKTVGGALFLGGLLIRVGAPFAHVWLKDAAPRASPIGAVALAIYPAFIGVYALARAFPGESALFFTGIAMIAIGACFAIAEGDLRRALTYSLLAQIGVAVAAIGIGSPLALAGAATHAFAMIFSYGLALMALGVFVRKHGQAQAADLAGAGAAAPVTTFLLLVGCLSAAAFPALCGYASFAVILEAAKPYAPLAWALMAGAGAAAAHTAVRPGLAVLTPGPAKPSDAPVFSMLLAMGIAAFICAVVGLAPRWLYDLAPPSPIHFAPFEPRRIAPHLSLIASAGAVYAALRAVRLAPRERPVRLIDVDGLYRGPLAGMGRWTGVVMLRLYGAWQAASAIAAEQAGRAFGRFANAGDRPYSEAGVGAAIFIALTAILALVSANP